MTFYTYMMRNYKGEDSPEGDLAEDMKSTFADFPRNKKGSCAVLLPERGRMTGLIEMMLLRAMSASAAHEEAGRRKRKKKADARAITCAVCHTYGGTMYKRGGRYICRDCRRKEEKRE